LGGDAFLLQTYASRPKYRKDHHIREIVEKHIQWQ
jgi:hypothetical protein